MKLEHPQKGDGLVKALVGARSDWEGSFPALVFTLVPGQVVTGV